MKCRFVAFLLWSAWQTCHSLHDENAREEAVTAVKSEVTDDGEGVGDGDDDDEFSDTWDGENEAIIDVTLLLTRHALSCANLVNDYPARWGFEFGHTLVLDPPLSECGKYRSRKLREGIKTALKDAGLEQVSFVLASHLLRAQQTAAYMYGIEKNITVAPYISEAGPGLDNQQAEGEKEHYVDDKYTEKLKNKNKNKKVPWTVKGALKGGLNSLVNGALNATRQDYYVFKKKTRKGVVHIVAGNTAPDWRLFEDFLFNKFLRDNWDGGKITIAVVSHSHFMKQEKVCGKKPENNEIFVLQYKYRPQSASDEEKRFERITPDAIFQSTNASQKCGTLGKLSFPAPPGTTTAALKISKGKNTSGSSRLLCKTEATDDIGCEEALTFDVDVIHRDTDESLAKIKGAVAACCTAYDEEDKGDDELNPAQTAKDTGKFRGWRARFAGGDDVEKSLGDDKTVIETDQVEGARRTQVRRVRSAVRKFVTRFVMTH